MAGQQQGLLILKLVQFATYKLRMYDIRSQFQKMIPHMLELMLYIFMTCSMALVLCTCPFYMFPIISLVTCDPLQPRCFARLFGKPTVVEPCQIISQPSPKPSPHSRFQATKKIQKARNDAICLLHESSSPSHPPRKKSPGTISRWNGYLLHHMRFNFHFWPENRGILSNKNCPSRPSSWEINPFSLTTWPIAAIRFLSISFVPSITGNKDLRIHVMAFPTASASIAHAYEHVQCLLPLQNQARREPYFRSLCGAVGMLPASHLKGSMWDMKAYEGLWRLSMPSGIG